MKTELEIKAELKKTKERIKEYRQMGLIEGILQQGIRKDTLNWVLKK